jgi:hypothetical protein
MTKLVSHAHKEAHVLTLTSIQSAHLYVNAVRSLGTREIGSYTMQSQLLFDVHAGIKRIINNIISSPETDWYKIRSSRSFNSSNNSGFVKHKQPWYTPIWI